MTRKTPTERMLASLQEAASASNRIALPRPKAVGQALDLGTDVVEALARERSTAAASGYGSGETLYGQIPVTHGGAPWDILAELWEGAGARRTVRLSWEPRSGAAVSLLGPGAERPDPEQPSIVLAVDGPPCAVALSSPDGGLYVFSVAGAEVQELLLAPPAPGAAPPVHLLAPPPWDAWCDGAVDGTVRDELTALARRGADMDAMAAAGVLVVHDKDPRIPSAARMAMVLGEVRIPTRADAWLESLASNALEAFENRAVVYVRLFQEDLLAEAASDGWRHVADVPRALRIERDRMELVREGLRERGQGRLIEAALAELDAAVLALWTTNEAAGDEDDDGDDRLVLAAALRADGWWTASRGRAFLETESEEDA